MASVDSFGGSSLWPEAVGEDVGMGGLFGFQGLRLSEAAVADKEGRLVKGRSDEKEEELVMVAPATSGIKGKAEDGCVNTVAVPGDAVEGEDGLTALPMNEVRWILAQKPLPLIPPADKEHLLKFYPPEMIDRIMETESRAFKAMATIQEEFLAFQDGVRKQFQEKGVVKVDDEFLARREQTCQWLREESDELFTRMETELHDSDFGNYSDMYGTDDDDDDSVEESTSN